MSGLCDPVPSRASRQADFMETSLQPMQRCIAAASLDEHIVGAVLDEAATFERDDPICGPHGRNPDLLPLMRAGSINA
jgi:hypothetical protein